MSKKTRIIISCVLVMLAFCAGIASYAFAYGNRSQIANADGTIDYFVDADGKIDVPVEPMAGTTVTEAERDANRRARGTENNPFFILEIAPYEGEGQFAYHIAGCEPVDVELMCWNNENVYGEGHLYTQTSGLVCIWEQDITSKHVTEGVQTANITQYGKMVYKADGTGNYNRTNETYVYDTAPEGYVGTLYRYDTDTNTHVEDVNGTLRRRVSGGTYTKVTGNASGDYLWVPLSVEDSLAVAGDETEKSSYESSVHEGSEFKMYFENVKYYYKTGGKILTHNNYFLRESVGLAYNVAADGTRTRITDESVIAEKIRDYHVVVYTVTPEDLNANMDLIDRADLISFVETDDLSHARNAYEKDSGKYLKEGVFSRASEVPREKNVNGATFTSHQLDWDTVVRLYERINDDKRPCPVLWDTDVHSDVLDGDPVQLSFSATVASGETYNIDEKSSQNNLYKLYLMLYQMPNASFSTFFGHPKDFSTVQMTGVSDKNGTLSTGVLDVFSSSDANRYWNKKTLYPWSILPSNKPEIYNPFMAAFGIMGDSGLFNSNDGGAQNFIRNAVYRNDGGNWMHQQFMSASGVKDDQYGHEVYDFFESIGESKTTVTSAECLYYLLNGMTSPSNLPSTEQYTVLNLQPSPKYGNETVLKAFVKSYAKTSVEPVIVNMTTSEFIGKHVECLSEYDMVYIGVNKASNDVTMMATTTSGSFPFVYAHTGPTATIEKYTESSYVWPTGWVTIDKERTALFGWLGTGSGLSANNVVADLERQFALSGNDLTNAAKDELLEYAIGGYPLVFGTGFFTSTAGTTVSSIIDLNSNVYNLVNEAGSDNYFYELGMGDSTLSTYLARKEKLQAAFEKSTSNDWIMHTSPLIYNSEAGSDDAKYINGDGSGSKELKFEFTIDAPSTTTFSVDLYVDVNGDGKFVESENITTSVRCVTDNNYVSATNGLRGGKRYRIIRQVDDRVGSVSWKLDLVSNGKVYKSLSGVSAIKTAEREQLRILQIISNDRQTVYLPQDSEVTGGVVNISGASSTQLQVAQWFYDYTRNINGFDISFVRMTEDELLLKLKDNPDYLMQEDAGDFQMIVLGFADAYNGVTFVGGSGTEYEYDVLMALEDYRADGRAILFTHDTSSLVGDGDTNLTENHSWGADVTERFRASFGMDRYDAVAYRARTGETRGDYPYVTTANSSNIGKLLTTSDNTNYLLTQGMTNGCLYRFLYKQEGTSYKAMGWSGSDGNLETNAISRVNKGGITEYPYTIPENITTATTHTQYYQLDLEDQDIVVWYCLAEPKSSNENGASLTIKDFAQAYYEVTPNDVRNNYYIYNIDNVTYSGMGHSGELTLSEVKLFINTFVAAYRAKAKPAEIFINNSDATKMAGGEKYLLCVDIDNSDASIAFGTDVVTGYQLTNDAGDTLLAMEDTNTDTVQAKRIYFTIKNNSTYGTTGCEYTLKLYVEEDGEANPDATTPLAVFRASDNVFMDGQTTDTKLTDDVEYYVDVPLTLDTKTINGASKNVVGTTEFMMSIFMEYGSEGDTTETIYTKADIVPRRLFMLD